MGRFRGVASNDTTLTTLTRGIADLGASAVTRELNRIEDNRAKRKAAEPDQSPREPSILDGPGGGSDPSFTVDQTKRRIKYEMQCLRGALAGGPEGIEGGIIAVAQDKRMADAAIQVVDRAFVNAHDSGSLDELINVLVEAQDKFGRLAGRQTAPANNPQTPAQPEPTQQPKQPVQDPDDFSIPGF